MRGTATAQRILRFGEYEVELQTGLLRKRGLRVRLREKSFQVLAFLMERRGGLVTRDELRERLWPGDVFVDFEQGLNAAVARLREALRDSADQPRYIETLPKRGYRFIGSVSEPAPCGEQPVPKKTRLV
ncbi:MAG: winged helix-turn-helix domain-containing protein, partial [Acidobacteria bacterium]|nr:winged helix-turn-helix domain-containing protein [Acidobacteriota bacterium]